MRIAEKTGKTVEEAICAGVMELAVDRDRVKVEVLEEPVKKGLFGLFGTTLARVRVFYEDNPGALAIEFIEKICQSIQVKADTQVSNTGEHWHINITGPELGILIGRRGDTLDALQYLTNLAVAKRLSERVRIIVDVEGYRQRREETLIRLAKRLSEKVKRNGTRIVLEPMNAHERRIIHTSLQDETRISTFSEGDDPNRRVVIALKRG
ncbi:RNA-binding cell elongation regulator Jag/EloR [Desulfosporosinus sp. BICA1-9]|uniref:RNA-binding cell elongation regulator Jag/EloR n=1 Tax=Desulfosporosinus sp. BICA1-9 TaxID=1531958 RepID=UPI00054B1987|nr:RNA-binding cell elongation regulator Jag/EloR [Desulfosporosinus sp. BICA1-9]KJS47615.1 MAG: DNA-binding protein [Peptococcaceae bacterium BRH_c23]KJS89651.1 MAG: DNA-binding protein [Desulfosporosinus sp. BICA1-9]